MTTTEETTTTEDLCPKCGTPKKHVEGTNVTYCNSCGQHWGEPKADPIEPTEVVTVEEKVEREVETSKAVERLADAALDMPEIPGRSEFMAVAMMARTLAQSQIIPKALQGKPSDVLVVLLTARDLQIPATTALSQIHVIDGKPTLSPKLLSARVQRMGLGRIVPAYKSDSLVIAAALGPNGTVDPRCGKAAAASVILGNDPGHWTGDDDQQICRCVDVLGFSAFSWKDAQQPTERNRLVDTRCQPNEHVVGCKCKTNWRNYGASRMLWQRVRGYCADDWFPTASLGLYAPEELGAITDEDGEPIDVDSVPVPSGFEQHVPPPDPMDERAPQELIDAMKKRVAHLPQEERQVLLVRWGEKVSEGRLGLVDELTARGLKIAGALVNGAESLAKSHNPGWKPYEPPEPVVDPPVAQPSPEPSEPVPSTDMTPEAPDGSQTPTEGQTEPVVTPARYVAQLGQAAPVVTEEIVDETIPLVSAMTIRQVVAALHSRGLAIPDAETDKRRILAEETAKEIAEQDWTEANA